MNCIDAISMSDDASDDERSYMSQTSSDDGENNDDELNFWRG